MRWNEKRLNKYTENNFSNLINKSEFFLKKKDSEFHVGNHILGKVIDILTLNIFFIVKV